MSVLRYLYFFQGRRYTSFGKNILLRQSTSLGHSATGHPVIRKSHVNILTDRQERVKIYKGSLKKNNHFIIDIRQ